MVNIGDGEYNHGRRNKTQLITQFRTIVIPNYPDEIAIEILSRLPHNFKFKSVCKNWHSLFSDPSFIKLHKKNHNEALLICSPQHHAVFLLHVKNPKTPLNLDHPFRNYLAPLMTLVGSINGLICLSNSPWAQSFVIWNPETNQHKYLPCPNNAYVLGTEYNISLGFCYHCPTSDYIVVRIARFGQRSKVELYSLNSDSWRYIENVLDYLVLFETCDTIVKGKPYWWAGRENSRFLVGFDISDNMLFTEVPTFKLNARSDSRFGRCKLANYNGLLAVLVDSTLSLSSLNSEYLGLGDSPEREFSERFINMLVLGDDGSWSVRLRVGFPRGMARVIGCSMNGRIILKDKSGMIVLFDSDNEKIESTNIVEAANDRSFIVSNYAASFVSIPIK